MNILICGDIVGRSGRDALAKHLPLLQKEFSLDAIIVNGENAANGYGITEELCKQLYAMGVHVITTGNHIWDQRQIISYIDQDPTLLRPLNYPPQTPGQGHVVITTNAQKKILVMNVMGRVFMEALDDPFRSIQNILNQYSLNNVDAIILDIHAEATSEKQAIACFFDGKISGVVGTHTHVPTADARILPQGTAYISDLGMCGDYDSILGMQPEWYLFGFIRRMPSMGKKEPAIREGTVCGLVIEVNKQGLANSITPVRRGGVLFQQ